MRGRSFRDDRKPPSPQAESYAAWRHRLTVADQVNARPGWPPAAPRSPAIVTEDNPIQIRGSFRCPSNNSQHCQEAPKGRRRPRAWAGVGQVAPRGLVAGGAEQVQADVAVAGRNQRLPVVPELDRHTANGWIIYLHRESLTQQATPGAFNPGSHPDRAEGLRTTQPVGPMIELRRAIKTPTRPPTTEKRQWRRRRYWARSTSGSCPLVSVSQIDRCPAKGRTGGLPMIQSRSPLRPTAQVHTSGRDSHPLGLWRDLLRT
jgi:hypothetical protein